MMKSSTFACLLFAASALLTSCGGSSGGGPADLTTANLQPTQLTTLTAPSGTALQGLVLTIPVGAVQDPVVVSLRTGQPTATGTTTIAGPAATFLPDNLVFAIPAVLDLPFDVGAVGSTAAALLRVQVRDDQTNQIVEVIPDSVDTSAGTVRLSVPRFSTCWVTTPDNGNPISGSASGTLTFTGADTGVVGTSLTVDSAEIGTNSYQFTNTLTGNPLGGTFAAVSVGTSSTTQNLTGVAIVFAVGFVGYGYVCLDIPNGPQQCDGVSVDEANRTVTFVNVVLANGSENSTAPLVVNGQLSWSAR